MAIDWGKVDKNAKALEKKRQKYVSNIVKANTPSVLEKLGYKDDTGSTNKKVGINFKPDSSKSKYLPKVEDTVFTLGFDNPGYVAKKAASGALSTVEGAGRYVEALSLNTLSGMTGLVGADKVSNKLKSLAENVASDSFSQRWGKKIEDDYTTTASQKLTGDVASAVGGMATPIGASAKAKALLSAGSGAAKIAKAGTKLKTPMTAKAAGKVGANIGLGIMGAGAAGNATVQGYQQTGDLNKSLTYGTLSGIAETATERIFGAIPFLGGGYADDAIKKVIGKVTSTPGVGKLLKESTSILGEGFEEIMVGIVDPFLQRATIDKDAPLATKEELAQQFTIGALAAGVLRGAHSGFNPSGKETNGGVMQSAEALNELAENLPVRFRPEPLQFTSRTTADDVKEFAAKVQTAAQEAAAYTSTNTESLPVDEAEIAENRELDEKREAYESAVQSLATQYGETGIDPEKALEVYGVDLMSLKADLDQAESDSNLSPTQRLEKQIAAGTAAKYYPQSVIDRYLTQQKSDATVYVANKPVSKTDLKKQILAKNPNATEADIEGIFTKIQYDNRRNEKVEGFVKDASKAFKAYGVKVDIDYNLSEAQNGYYDPSTKKIVLNGNTIRSRGVASYVTAHEITHHAVNNDPNLLNDLKISMKMLGYDINEMNASRKAAYVKQTGKQADDEYMAEESIADFVSMITRDDSILTQLAQKRPTVLERIRDFLVESLTFNKQDRMSRKYKREAIKRIQAALAGKPIPKNRGNASNRKGKSEGAKYSLTDTLFVSEDGLAPRYSLDTSEQTLAAARAYNKKYNIADDETLQKYVRDINNQIAKLLQPYEDKLSYQSAEGLRALKPNSDPEYTVSLDFSTLCRKRLVLQGTVEEIQKRLGRGLYPEEILETRNLLKSAGVEVSCGACYVEATRQRLGAAIEVFYNERMGEWIKPSAHTGQAYPTDLPPKELFFSQAGMDVLRLEYPVIYDEFRAYINPQSIKTPESRTEYKGEIIDYFKNRAKLRDSMNRASGLRWQSWSDFEVEHLVDIMQAITDMSVVGLKGHAYTKVIDFARLMAETDMMVNCSLMPAGEEGLVNGKLAFDPVEGMDYNEAKKLRKLNSNTIGTIAIGVSNKQTRLLLRDKTIDYVIPYHASGLSEEARKVDQSGMDKWMDYTLVNMETIWEGGKLKKLNAKKLEELGLRYGDYWDANKTPKENADHYLTLCRKAGVTPRFGVTAAVGTKNFESFTNETNYWKLLIDRKMINNEGELIEQKVVKPVFSSKVIKDIVGNFEGHKSTLPVHQETVEKMAEKRYSLTAMEPADIKFSLVTDKDTLAFLDKQKPVHVYRAMQLIDGELYPPMAAKVAEEVGGKRKIVTPSKKGAWEQAEERPELADENGHFILDKGNGKQIKARYNPYFHASRMPLNDQFTSAYDRPNLVVVEGVVPESELTSGYRAEKAKDAVGEMSWHSGPVSSKLPESKRRQVILSRWFKPLRVVPNSEVAQAISTLLDGEDIPIPSKVVTPALLEELEKLGVPIKEPDTRYSLQNNSDGNPLTEAQDEFFKDSKVRDDDGKLMPMYHGTRSEINTFDSNEVGGLFNFAPTYSRALTYAESGGGFRKRGKAKDFVLFDYDNNAFEWNGDTKQYEVTGSIPENEDLDVNSWRSIREGVTNRNAKIGEVADTEDTGFMDDVTITNKKAQVKEVYLNLKNPLDITDKKTAIKVFGSIKQKLDKSGMPAAVLNQIDSIIHSADNGLYFWNSTKYEPSHRLYANVLVPELTSMGYDGLYFFDDGHFTYSAFDPEQIKSVDNLNPTTDPDIRYSLQRNSDGNPLTEGQKEYFADSKAVDEYGNLKKVYHGTMSDFFEFSKKYGNPEGDMGAGFYFTDNDEDVWENYASENGGDLTAKIGHLQEQLMDGGLDEDEALEQARREFMTRTEPRLIEAYLNITNPIILDGGDSTVFDFNGNYDEPEGLFADFVESIKNVLEDYEDGKHYIGEIDEMYESIPDDGDISAYNAIKDAKRILSYFIDYDSDVRGGNEVIRQALEDMGFDGIIDKMVAWKFGDHSGRRFPMAGVTPDTTHYIVFSSNQAKEASNENPTDTPDIRYSLSKSLDEYLAEWESAKEKYGTKDPGMNPRVEDRANEVPEQIEEGTRVSDSARSIYEAYGTPEEFIPDLQLYILSGTGSYIPLQDKVAQAKVDRNIARNGLKHATEEWRGLTYGKGAMSKESILLGETLLIEAADRGDRVEWERLVAELCAEATRAGQNLQAFSMLKKLSPAGRAFSVEQFVKKLQADLDARTKGKGPDLVIDEELFEQLKQAKTLEEIGRLEELIIADVSAQVPSRISDRVVAWRYLSMLGNSRTHIRNIVSNATMFVVRSAKDTVGAGVEAAASRTIAKGMERTKTRMPASAETKAFVKQDWSVMAPTLAQGGPLEFEDMFRKYRNTFGNSIPGKVLNRLEKINSGALTLEDVIFMGLGYRSALRQYMTSNNLTAEFLQSNTKEANEALAKARDYATREGLKATYREANTLATTLNSLENKNVATKLIIGGLMPFKKTPLNIIKRGVEYSPAGLLEAVTAESVRLAKGSITPAHYIDRLASGLTGTGAFALGVWLAMMGVIKAGMGDDKEEYYEQMQGQQPYSVRIRDRTYTLDWLTPISMPVMAGVELVAELLNGDDEEINFNRMVEAMLTTADPMTELSMLQGINQAINSFEENKIGAAVQSAAQSYAGQFVPTMFGQVTRTVDPVRRTTYAPKDTDFPFGKPGQQFANKMINKADIFNRVEKEPYIDMWGREEVRPDNIALRAFEQLVFPYYAKDVQKTAVDDEISRVFAVNGETRVLPGTPKSYLTIDKERYNMSPSDFTEFKRKSGQEAYKTMEAVFRTPAYRKMDQESKEKVIADVFSFAREDAKVDYAEKNRIEYEPESILSKVDTAEAAGIDVGKFFVAMQDMSALKGDIDPATNRATTKDKAGLLTRKTKKADYLSGLNLTGEQMRVLFSLD